MQFGPKWLLVSFAVLALVGILLAGVAFAQTPLTITLNEQNGSGESGTATLTDLGNGMVRVDVTVSGQPADSSQPMHIHTGKCPNPGPVVYPLNDLVDGKSTTEITTTLETLLASPHALNGHKSAAELQVYVFCGDVVEASMQETATTTAEATTTVEATATSEATTEATAEATPTAQAATAAEATPTPAETLPTTGTSSPLDALIPVVLVGAILLTLGLYVRRLSR
jgi:cytoskeletal protein RodZ